MKSLRTIFWILVTAYLTLVVQKLEAAGYDPLSSPDGITTETLELVVHDAKRSRDIPVKVYLPARCEAEPVVLFSHGLGGSREGCGYLGEHWSAFGYVAVFLQHPGSDASVWEGKALKDVYTDMKKAASAKNFRLRVEDVSAVLDQLIVWNATEGHALFGRLDMDHVGMSGHSFGAITTQAVSGESFLGGAISYTDPRIRAAIPMSPSSPRRGNATRVFSKVSIPWLLMTGTEDVSPINDTDVASRLAVYTALPPGEKYEIVLDGAEHSAFTDRALPGDSGPRKPNHHRVILGLSTAFWDVYLKGDPDAKAWLDGDGPATILDPADRWQHK